jgi:hypothetical protein
MVMILAFERVFASTRALVASYWWGQCGACPINQSRKGCGNRFHANIPNQIIAVIMPCGVNLSELAKRVTAR